MYLAGTKALGLISKFITLPLWRLIEQPAHILDMNNHISILLNFIDIAGADSESSIKFMAGEKIPFDEPLDDSNKVVRKLIQPNEEIDEICLPLLQAIFVALSQLLRRMVSEHLPGGIFYDPSEQLKQQTSSALKHNKLPEFIFAQLDHLVSYRPNASVLANEAYIMYSFNKTSLWLQNLPADERNLYLEQSRKDGKLIREKFKKRLKAIEIQRLEEQKKKQLENERHERLRIEKAENLTKDICYYGLWQTHQQVDEVIASYNVNKTEIIKALQCQLKFRRDVLKQVHSNKKVYNFSMKMASGKYKKLSLDEMKTNLLSLVKTALDVPTEEKQ